MLKAMGVPDLLAFDFMDPPPQQTLFMAMESLFALGALDDEGMLTKLGRKMAEFPLEPAQSKMVIASVDFGCSDEILAAPSPSGDAPEVVALAPLPRRYFESLDQGICAAHIFFVYLPIIYAYLTFFKETHQNDRLQMKSFGHPKNLDTSKDNFLETL